MDAKRRQDNEYSDQEAERRAREAIKRSFEIPYKPQSTLVGKTPRAKAMARKRKSRGQE
jgi:hypothetical protein